MKNLELTDLHNPDGITGFVHSKNGNFYTINDNQAIQVYYGKKYPSGMPMITRLEIWQKFKDGRLFKVIGFNGSSIGAIYV